MMTVYQFFFIIKLWRTKSMAQGLLSKQDTRGHLFMTNAFDHK